MEHYKQLASEFLINSFVEKYDAYRQYIDVLNNELDQQSIPYHYTYDEFCVELLNRFLNTINRLIASNRMDEFSEKFEELLSGTVNEISRNVSSSKYSSFYSNRS
ncbi:MAG: hypothetical protein ACM3PX_11805 [Omnitrophica WOR_2 bacterium]|jgi:GGDEF domain-containing protein